MNWFRDGAALTQMTALINRYGMDASDQEVCEELSGLRSVVAQLWLDVEPNQLKTLYDRPCGPGDAQPDQLWIRAGVGRCR